MKRRMQTSTGLDAAIGGCRCEVRLCVCRRAELPAGARGAALHGGAAGRHLGRASHPRRRLRHAQGVLSPLHSPSLEPYAVEALLSCLALAPTPHPPAPSLPPPAQNFMLRATALLPHTRYSDSEWRSMAQLAAHQEYGAAFAVAGGTTLELTLAQYWSRWVEGGPLTRCTFIAPRHYQSGVANYPASFRRCCTLPPLPHSLGDATLSAELAFHGVQVIPAKVSSVGPWLLPLLLLPHYSCATAPRFMPAPPCNATVAGDRRRRGRLQAARPGLAAPRAGQAAGQAGCAAHPAAPGGR